jgi:adenylate kinase family enzyme
MRRIAVVGSGGAGKTTFATELGRCLDLPVIHLDHHYWKPGWVSMPAVEWAKVQRQLLAGDSWIVDGNYGSTYAVRFERADTVIVLALARWRCLLRVLRRWWLHRGEAIQAPGCHECFSPEFLRWVWNYPKRDRKRLQEALRQHTPAVSVITLRTPAEVREFLAGSTQRIVSDSGT